MTKQAWRYDTFEKNSEIIYKFCADRGYKTQDLNNGYQIRVNGAIDLYPVRAKWHNLESNRRGDIGHDRYIDMKDLKSMDKERMFDAPIGVKDKEYVFEEKTTVQPYQPTEAQLKAYEILTNDKPRKWWQFWRK